MTLPFSEPPPPTITLSVGSRSRGCHAFRLRFDTESPRHGSGCCERIIKHMTHDEAIDFLSSGTRTGKLATVRRDGRPHVTPIWFVVDGDDLVFNTWYTSAKAKHLARDPRASLVVDLEEAPYAYVLVEGTVTISHDLDEITAFATRIGARYMGPDRAKEFGARNGVEGELLVRLHMDRVIALDEVSS